MHQNLRALRAPWPCCAFAVAVFVVVGCGQEKAVKNFVKQRLADASQQIANDTRVLRNEPSARSTPVRLTTSAAGSRPQDRLRIATFNIQVFGTSKSAQPDVMDVLAEVVRRFDVVAIQEIRSKDDTVLPDFVERINTAGERYDFVIGPRLGRTTSKEQYVFVFDTARVELVDGSVYTVSDPRDRLHREPLVAGFRAREASAAEPFSFTLVNIHTDPDETELEMDALDDVFLAVQRHVADDDVILLGDLNVDDKHLGELGRVPNVTWVISGEPTNTRRTKSYDNIVFARDQTTEFTGTAGVLNLIHEFHLTEDQALKVSDHMPVWAEFRAHELPKRMAGNSSAAVKQ